MADSGKWTRRGALRAVGGAAVGGALLSGATDTAAGQDGESWPQFGYDGANTGYASTNTGIVDQATEAWSFETGDWVEISSPAVADGTVYIGGKDNYVHALDAESGGEQWNFETGESVVSAPAAVGGTVYVTSGDNNVYALNAKSGDEQWNFETGGMVASSAAVVDDTVYVGSGDNNVYALDTGSGDEQWTFETGNQVGSSPAVMDGTVYVGSFDNYVYALDAESGEEQWRFETGDTVFSSPAVAGDTIYIGGLDNYIYALDTESGEEQWRFETGSGVLSSPAVVDGTIYVGSDDKNVYAIEAESGTEQWRFETGDGVPSSPAIVDNTVYVGSNDGNVYALDARSGDERWHFETGEAVGSSPAVVDGTVYVGSSDTNVYAISGEMPTPTPTSAPTTTPAGQVDDIGGDGSGGTDATDTSDDSGLPVLPIAGAAAAGAGGLWYWQRNGDDVHGPTRTSGEQSSAAEQNKTESTNGDGRYGSSSVSESDGTGTRGDRRGHTTNENRGPPERIPSSPSISIDYNSLTDEAMIGGGGNADVTKATLPTPEGDVVLAIKKPRMQGTLHTETVERLLDEAETWNKLDDHDHIVGVVDYDAEPVPWIAMEYMDAGDLSDRAGELGFDQALWTAVSITRGVRHAHRRGVAHLDLKPTNVLFREVEGAWDVPKVADWGLSKHLLEHSKSVEGLSPQYAAPEQFDDEYGAADDITDVYQLGAVFYELFTGRPPFEGRPAKAMHRVLNEEPTPPSEVADVPDALDDVLLTALAKEKDDRFESVLYFRDALDRLGED